MQIIGWQWILIGLWLWGITAYAADTMPETNALKKAVSEPAATGKLVPVANTWKTALVGTWIVAILATVEEHVNPSISAVAIGGALGSVTRYLVSHSVGHYIELEYPYAGTITVNIVGSFIFGLVSGAAGLREDTPEGVWASLVTTGFLGGFTTFSLFAHDTIGLAHNEGFYSAIFYTTASVMFSVAGMLAGEYVGAALMVP